MFSRIRHIASSYPAFLLLLPVFFVWHGYVEFYGLIAAKTALFLVLQYSAACLLLFLICIPVFKKRKQAHLFAFSLMAVNLLFGGFQDFLTGAAPGSLLTKYSFQLSFIFFLLIILLILLRKQKINLPQTFLYLNLLFSLLIIADLAWLVSKKINRPELITKGNRVSFSPCANCPAPDVYLIIADGYSGFIPLKRIFQYDNSRFENALRQRHFFVADSSFANYDYTVFSMGSMLNLDYLNTTGYFRGKRDLPLAFAAIRHSRVQQFFEAKGYQTFNHSIFDLASNPSPVIKTLMRFDRSPLTTQTFSYRVIKDLGYHIVTLFRLPEKKRNTAYHDLSNNQKIDSLTRAVAVQNNAKPKFVYAHLMLPHHPYYFDSLGRPNKLSQITSTPFHESKVAYISYLNYANNKLLSLIDHILTHSVRPPLIILAGDHGCRPCLEKENKSSFQTMNLAAIFVPDSNYSGYYKGISNINLMRQMFNTQFGQQLPMLKDSFVLVNPDKKYLR